MRNPKTKIDCRHYIKKKNNINSRKCTILNELVCRNKKCSFYKKEKKKYEYR